MSPNPDQALEALHLGNTRRLAQAKLKAEVAAVKSKPASCRRAARVLRDTPRLVESLRVGHLLTACHTIGSAKADVWLRRAGIMSADRPLSSLTDGQRRLLIDQLEGRTVRPRFAPVSRPASEPKGEAARLRREVRKALADYEYGNGREAMDRLRAVVA